MNEFQFTPRYLSLLDDIHFIKINAQHASEVTIRNTVEIAHSMNIKCIVTHIDDEKLYQRAVALGADGLEGPYVAAKLTTQAHSSAYIQSNFFRLMVAVTKDEPNVEEIEQMIAADASLSYGLLKMVNSAYFALRHRATTITQAIMTLGLGQLKQWIYLLSASNAENEVDPGSEEFLKRSFMRAYFCSELMKHAKNMPISRSEAYLMGMFSTLEYMIDAPIEEILFEIPIIKEVKDALIYQEGMAGKLYQLILHYERAEWSEIKGLAEDLGLHTNELAQIYMECVEEVNDIWDNVVGVKEEE